MCVGGRGSEDLCLGYVPAQGLYVFTLWILHLGAGKVSLRASRVGMQVKIQSTGVETRTSTSNPSITSVCTKLDEELCL